MLIINGQRAIKDRRSRRILPERAEAYVQDHAKATAHILLRVEPMYELRLLQRVRGLRLAHDSVREAPAQVRLRAESRDRLQPVWRPGVAASLLTVWSHASNPRSRERGGRTPRQRDGNRCKLSTIPDCTVCPSDSRFHSITKDLRRFREMPSFALSRRQHGFESRWGHKIKSLLTRPNTSPPCVRFHPQHEVRAVITSSRPRAFRSFITRSQNLAPSVCSTQIPSTSFLPSKSMPRRDERPCSSPCRHRGPYRRWRRGRSPAKSAVQGRACHSLDLFHTASVILEIRSGKTSMS